MRYLPFTHAVDPEWATRALDYEEMRALANLFEEWAFHEFNIDADQRTLLIQLSSDYEAMADACGSEWQTIEDLIDVTQHKTILHHIRAAHMLG